MIAVDTSTLIAFNAGQKGDDVDRLTDAFRAGLVVLPPTVLSEILSDPRLPKKIESEILKLPMIELQAGFWERVGQLRKTLIKRGLKARLADSQIAQSCIDAQVSLITRDKDFKNIAAFSDLRLLLS